MATTVDISDFEDSDNKQYAIWRKLHKIKLKDISNYAGVSVSTLSRFENNLKSMPDVYVKKYDEFIRNFELRRFINKNEKAE